MKRDNLISRHWIPLVGIGLVVVLQPLGASLSFVTCPAINYGSHGRAHVDRDQALGIARLTVWAVATSTSEFRSVPG